MSRRTDLDYVSAVSGAVASFWSWTLATLVVWSLGVWLAGIVSHRGFGIGIMSFVISPLLLPLSPIIALFAGAGFLAATLLVAALWALPMYFDWVRIRIPALVAIFALAYLAGNALFRNVF